MSRYITHRYWPTYSHTDWSKVLNCLAFFDNSSVELILIKNIMRKNLQYSVSWSVRFTSICWSMSNWYTHVNPEITRNSIMYWIMHKLSTTATLWLLMANGSSKISVAILKAHPLKDINCSLTSAVCHIFKKLYSKLALQDHNISLYLWTSYSSH